ncbi:MAG: hypothetical protein JNM00_15005 [Flavobacteriales bacterium]|nr:hypothetical protein [Flavobacteriales bacterium]
MKKLLLPLLLLLASAATALAADPSVPKPGDPKKDKSATQTTAPAASEGFSLADGYLGFFKLLLFTPDSTRTAFAPADKFSAEQKKKPAAN